MLADLRDAMLQLRKAPGFTTKAIITLALGSSDHRDLHPHSPGDAEV
jgi:hypothetical protein